MTIETVTVTAENNEQNLMQYMQTLADFMAKNHKGHPGYKYTSLMDFVLTKGEMLSKEPFTPAEEAFLLRLFSGHRAYKTRACYENAYQLTYRADWDKHHAPGMKIEYGEGHGDSGLIPVAHAVMVLNGKAVDLTWREDTSKGNRTRSAKALLERARYCQRTNAYYVVRFPLTYVNTVLVKTGTYGVIEFNADLAKQGRAAWEGVE